MIDLLFLNDIKEKICITIDYKDVSQLSKVVRVV